MMFGMVRYSATTRRHKQGREAAFTQEYSDATVVARWPRRAYWRGNSGAKGTPPVEKSAVVSNEEEAVP